MTDAITNQQTLQQATRFVGSLAGGALWIFPAPVFRAKETSHIIRFSNYDKGLLLLDKNTTYDPIYTLRLVKMYFGVF